MTETKVYKIHKNKQVEDITTMLKIEGISYNVFEYEEYTAIEVTSTPLDNKRLINISTDYNCLNRNKMENLTFAFAILKRLYNHLLLVSHPLIKRR